MAHDTTARLASLLLAGLLVLAGAAAAEEPPAPASGEKQLSGMSILGNDEAPKSLVIVPWKSSQLGHTIDLSRMLQDGREPVDRDVFLRELDYYRIRAGKD